MAIALLTALVGMGCNDDGATVTGSGSSTGSEETSSEGSSVTLTSADTSSSSADTSGTATTDPTTETTIADTTTTDATTTDATTTSPDDSSSSDASSSDGTTGDPVLPGRTHSQLVNVGDSMSSASYQMEFTLGQPSQLQSTHNSANYRMQGGLIGANGSPP